jgi:hypothetical protein
MSDFVRNILHSRTPQPKTVVHDPPSLEDDYEARLLALLIERAGGGETFSDDEVAAVPNRLLLVPMESEDGLRLEVRRLAPRA